MGRLLDGLNLIECESHGGILRRKPSLALSIKGFRPL
jgi:hypothetical protein